MRRILTLLMAGTLAATAQQAPNRAQQAEQSYAKGLAAEKAGDPAGAAAAYAEALQFNPGHAHARYRLGEMKNRGGSIAAKGRETKFGAVIIPQIALEEATVAEALEVLRVGMEKASNGEVAPNFVVKDPDRKFDKSRVSFQLKSVPAKAILDYILSQGGGKATFEEYAVVIEPRGGGGQ